LYSIKSGGGQSRDAEMRALAECNDQAAKVDKNKEMYARVAA